FLEVGVNHIIVSRLASLGGALCSSLLSLHVGVHFFAQLLGCRRQGFDLGIDGGLVAVLQGFFKLLQGCFNGFLVCCFELVAILFQRLACGMQQRIGLIARGGQFGNAVIFLGIGLGILHHAFDLFVAQAGIGL